MAINTKDITNVTWRPEALHQGVDSIANARNLKNNKGEYLGGVYEPVW